MSFYTDMAATAAEMLREFGAEATLVHQGSSTYNPATGTNTVSTTTDTITACEVKAERSYIDGTMIAEGLSVFLVSTEGLTTIPKAGDVLQWGGAPMKVEKVGTLAPAGVAVLHEVQAR